MISSVAGLMLLPSSAESRRLPPIQCLAIPFALPMMASDDLLSALY
jgi:hypothetical protein